MQHRSVTLRHSDCPAHLCYNDSQLCISVPASESQMAAAQLAACVEGLDQWMGSNRLKLNAKKTQLIWIGTRQQLAKLTVTHLQLINSVVEFDSTTTNLGVVLDGQLSMSQQVTAVCRSCFHQLYVSSLTREALHSLILLFRLLFSVGLTTATLRWLEW